MTIVFILIALFVIWRSAKFNIPSRDWDRINIRKLPRARLGENVRRNTKDEGTFLYLFEEFNDEYE